jgi:4-methyl-5(b-hydroxyethyl)-thiazole monophosphate biosynthesis
VSCFHNLKLVPDMHISNVNIDDYDAIAIPGGWPGTPFNEQTNGETFQKLITDACNKNKVIATMCFGIFPLGEAGLLDGVKATSFTSEDETCPT